MHQGYGRGWGKHLRSKSYRQDKHFRTVCHMVENLLKKAKEKMQAYCIKDQRKVEIKNPKDVIIRTNAL